MNQCGHLIRLAESWRMKADNVRRRYGKTSPVGTANVVLALETCAEELEEELRRVPGGVPSAKLQGEGSAAPNLKPGT